MRGRTGYVPWQGEGLPRGQAGSQGPSQPHAGTFPPTAHKFWGFGYVHPMAVPSRSRAGEHGGGGTGDQDTTKPNTNLASLKAVY